jgi:hypothetical protein
MKRNWAIAAGLLLSINLLAQPATQTIRGKVVDAESKFPLIGVNIVLSTDEGETKGAVTDIDGMYELEEVPVGRQTLEFSYIGYEKVLLNNIVVSSGREVILNVSMTESVMELQTVEVVGVRSGETRNEMAPVSGRQFNVEETDRYAGSRGDVGRMAANFAGVQGADDSRNDIVIRGNSPLGLLWRFEGVNIPNPNHFSIPGTTGGPVAILNNKYLENSDFFTGAFPAEYGNGIAGVFDVRMRNGNNRRHEFSVQFGVIGTELTAEGPLSKEKQSSYLATYRYSTLRLFDLIGVRVGTNAAPAYQDGAFRFNFPTAKGGNLAFWGIGGYSKIEVINSDLEGPGELKDNPDLYSESDRDQTFGSQMGVAGVTFTQPLNPSAFIKATVSASHQATFSEQQKIFRHVEGDRFVVDSLPPFLNFFIGDSKLSAYLAFNKKLNKKTAFKAGLNTDYWIFNYVDSFKLIRINPGPDGAPLVGDWRLRWDTRGEGAVMFQPYVQFRRQLGKRLSAMAGVTGLYFGLNDNSFSPVEPRLGLVYSPADNQRINLGYGLHSQILPPYVYFYGLETKNGDPQEHNLDLSLLKSHHGVLGYDWFIAKAMRFRLETYYQHLYNVPVEKNPSAFSLVNAGSGFDRLFPDTLVNEGIARNYGLEATVERNFSKGYYLLLAGSVFNSRYRGSDNIWRNTTFNGRVSLNGVFAREFTFSKGSALNLGAKVNYTGGRWRGEVDKAASDAAQDVVYINETVNTIQLKPYFRADLKLAYRWNRPKTLHEFSIDLVNITNRKNLLLQTYVPDFPEGDYIQETYQLGFLPIFFYKLEFGVGK